jgi:hypothetical protein
MAAILYVRIDLMIAFDVGRAAVVHRKEMVNEVSQVPIKRCHDQPATFSSPPVADYASPVCALPEL